MRFCALKDCSDYSLMNTITVYSNTVAYSLLCRIHLAELASCPGLPSLLHHLYSQYYMKMEEKQKSGVPTNGGPLK